MPWFQTPLQPICWILPSQTGTYKGRGMKLQTNSSSFKTADETCRPSQVSSGRPGIGQKRVWLMVLHFKLRNGVFPHLHFLLDGVNALPSVESDGNSLQALVWEISWRNNGCGMSHLPWHYFSVVPKSSCFQQNLAVSMKSDNYFWRGQS